MKTFKEFVAEAKKGVEGDHHAEAAKLVKKHDKHIEDATDEPEDGKLHLSGVHKDKVHKLHADLEKAGYKGNFNHHFVEVHTKH